MFWCRGWGRLGERRRKETNCVKGWGHQKQAINTVLCLFIFSQLSSDPQESVDSVSDPRRADGSPKVAALQGGAFRSLRTSWCWDVLGRRHGCCGYLSRVLGKEPHGQTHKASSIQPCGLTLPDPTPKHLPGSLQDFTLLAGPSLRVSASSSPCPIPIRHSGCVSSRPPSTGTGEVPIMMCCTLTNCEVLPITVLGHAFGRPIRASDHGQGLCLWGSVSSSSKRGPGTQLCIEGTSIHWANSNWG